MKKKSRSILAIGRLANLAVNCIQGFWRLPVPADVKRSEQRSGGERDIDLGDLVIRQRGNSGSLPGRPFGRSTLRAGKCSP
jgi:hypothetical protein